MIAKNTDKMVFTSSMYAPEDSHCVICLGDYEEDEELRKLPCKRMWLVIVTRIFALDFCFCSVCAARK